jgi:hypothetical protein
LHKKQKTSFFKQKLSKRDDVGFIHRVPAMLEGKRHWQNLKNLADAVLWLGK